MNSKDEVDHMSESHFPLDFFIIYSKIYPMRFAREHIFDPYSHLDSHILIVVSCAFEVLKYYFINIYNLARWVHLYTHNSLGKCTQWQMELDCHALHLYLRSYQCVLYLTYCQLDTIYRDYFVGKCDIMRNG